MPENAQRHVADFLMAAIDAAGAPVCVGIDPVRERLPALLRSAAVTRPTSIAAIEQFCRGVLEAVEGVAPAVKFQSACFERYGSGGVGALERLIRAARQRRLIVILDAKRGDIGFSAEHYAAAAIGNESHRADWITINPYLGEDSIRPFINAHLGAFALVRTSNEGGDELQSARLESGDTVAEHVAKIIARIGDEFIGESGYSSLGAVVGATKPDDAARLRDLMPRQFFLVPGFGAQGGTADDVRACFNHDGRGAIITASRSVIYAFEKRSSDGGDDDWQDAVHTAAKEFAQTVREAL